MFFWRCKRSFFMHKSLKIWTLFFRFPELVFFFHAQVWKFGPCFFAFRSMFFGRRKRSFFMSNLWKFGPCFFASRSLFFLAAQKVFFHVQVSEKFDLVFSLRGACSNVYILLKKLPVRFELTLEDSKSSVITTYTMRADFPHRDSNPGRSGESGLS